MKIQIVSDLHLEKGGTPPALAPGADMLICAGDLGEARYPWLLAKAAKAWRGARHILYVPGNHEYYGGLDLEESRQLLAWQCSTNGVTLLDPGAVTIAGVRFIGATLWTDFRLEGIAQETAAHANAARRMEDFKGEIRSGGGTRNFTTHESAERHRAERAFIERALESARETATTTVVITHHAPTPRSVAARFRDDPCNGGFASDLERVIERYQPPLWIHGHMHDAVDTMLGDTRVLCNPAGYDAARAEHRGFDPQLCVDIDAEPTPGARRA